MLNPQGYIKIGIGLSCFTIPRHCGPLVVLIHHISGRITIVIEGMSVKTKSDPDLDSLAQLVEHRTFNPRVTGSNPVRVMPKRLHELTFIALLRFNNLNKVVKSFSANIMCDRYASARDPCILGTLVKVGVTNAPRR